jgi:hypothetical protein
VLPDTREPISVHPDGTVHVGSTVLRPFANRNRTSPAAVPVGNDGVNDVNIDDPDVDAELLSPNV